MMHRGSKIYIAGHTGLVGSALVRKLQHEQYRTLITRTFDELDLRNQQSVLEFFAHTRPEYVFLAAAHVGGIYANAKYPAEFIYNNLLIQSNVMHAAYVFGVHKLLFLGSSCIYPRDCPQPIKEEYLLTGMLEKTNEAYAIAKIAGITMAQAYNQQYGTMFISCMPTNLYGPYDNFDIQAAHVIPSLIAKMCKAQHHQEPVVEIWGTGAPRREFLFVDDLADALYFLMHHYDDSAIINVGTGQDISIFSLAHLIKDIVGFQGSLVFNPAMPDGTPRKLLNSEQMRGLGWQAKISLMEGIKKTVEWYKAHFCAMNYVQPTNNVSERLS